MTSFIPGVSEAFWIKTATATVSSAAGLGIRKKKGQMDVEALDTCFAEAKRREERLGGKKRDARTSVAFRLGEAMRCTPYGTGSQVLTWEDYGEMGIDGGI